MITDQYIQFLEDLKANPNVKILDHLTREELSISSSRMLRNEQQALADENIMLTDDDLIFFQLSDISVVWEGNVTAPNETILDGGFVMNGLTDALTFPSCSDFWKPFFDIGPDEKVPEDLEHYNRLGWFERRPDGMRDKNRGCFIREKGSFPPPIAFYTPGWYTSLNMSYEEYLNLMFENFAFRGWQFFYIDIPADIPLLDDILEEMRVAVKMLPLNFPDKDWSYHTNRYNEVLKQLGK